jgi:hypothetical protein
MGRKSALTPEQWAEIERRILLEGETAYKLALEFGVNESSIRRRIKPSNADKADKAEFGAKAVPELRQIAERKAASDHEQRSVTKVIEALPYMQQQVVMTLAQRLTNISNSIASAAECGAATSHRLAAIANGQVAHIDDANPFEPDSLVALKNIGVLTELANKAAEIPLGLLKAHKATIDDLNKGGGDKPPPTRITYQAQDASKPA